MRRRWQRDVASWIFAIGAWLLLIPPIAAADLCRDARLEGHVAHDFAAQGVCDIAQPVVIVRVDQISLSRPALLDCSAAKALADWVAQIKPSARPLLGKELSGLVNGPGFQCRNIRAGRRTSKRMSEHAFGRALDITGFDFTDGTHISVLRSWQGKRDAQLFLRRASAEACGIFGTVLTPRANALHADHFHFDSKERRSAYCD